MSEWKATITADTSQVKAALDALKNEKIEVKIDTKGIQSKLDAIFNKEYTLKVNTDSIGKDMTKSVEKAMKGVNGYDFTRQINTLSQKYKLMGGGKNAILDGVRDNIAAMKSAQKEIFKLGTDNGKGGLNFGENADAAAEQVAQIRKLMKTVNADMTNIKLMGKDLVDDTAITNFQRTIDNLKDSMKLNSTDLAKLNGISQQLATGKVDQNLYTDLATQYKDAYASAKKYQELNKLISTGKGQLDVDLAMSKALKYGGDNNSNIRPILSDLEQAQRALDKIYSLGVEDDNGVFDFGDNLKEAKSALNEYKEAITEVGNELKTVKAEGNAFADSISVNRLGTKISDLADNSTGGATTALRQLREQMDQIQSVNGGITEGQLGTISAAFSNIQTEADGAGSKVQSFGSQLKGALMQATVGQVSLETAFDFAKNQLRDMYENVKNVDAAMVELRKVTDETDKSYASFQSSAGATAKELGTTIPNYINSTADFARLGYGFEEAQELSKTANIYNVVGDDLEGIDDATQTIVSTMSAFGIEAKDSISIVDKLNNVSNKYAISSGGLGQALQRSASSMKTANNTLDETIALTTAANTVVQDPKVIGTAFKTLSMRLRGTSLEEIEEAGGEIEGMTKTVASLRQDVLDIAGFDIMENDTTFKSTYDILKEFAAVKDDLTDIDYAYLLEQFAGKRQGNVLAAVLDNFDIAESALKDSMTSTGSAYAEHAKAMDSVEAKANQVQVSMEQLSQSVLNTDMVKGGLDLGSGLLGGLNTIIEKAGLIPTVMAAASTAMSLFADQGLFKRDNVSQFFHDIFSSDRTAFNEADGFVEKMKVLGQDLFGKTEFNLTEDQSATIDSNTDALMNYVNQVKHGVTDQNELNRSLETASAQTKAYAEANKQNFRTMDDEHIEAAFRANEAAKAYSDFLVGEESGNWFTRARSMIKMYNKNLEETEETQQAFNGAIKDNSKSMGSYIDHLEKLRKKNKEAVEAGEAEEETYNASFAGYVGNSLKNGLKSAGTTLVTGLMNGLVSGGISLLTDAVMSGISYLWDRANNWRKYQQQEQMATGAQGRQDTQSLTSLYDNFVAADLDYRNGIGSSQELTEATSALTSALGLEASEVDNLIAKYGSLSSGLKQATNQKMDLSLDSLQTGIKGQVSALKSAMNGEGWLGVQGEVTFENPLNFAVGTEKQQNKIRDLLKDSPYARLAGVGAEKDSSLNAFYDLDFTSAEKFLDSWDGLIELRDTLQSTYSESERKNMSMWNQVQKKVQENSAMAEQVRQDVDLNNDTIAKMRFNEMNDLDRILKSDASFQEIRKQLVDKLSSNDEGLIYDRSKENNEGLKDIVTNYLAEEPVMAKKYQAYIREQEMLAQQTARGLIEAQGKWRVEDLFPDSKVEGVKGSGDPQFEQKLDGYLSKSKALKNAYKDALSGDLDTSAIDKLGEKFPELAAKLKAAGNDTKGFAALINEEMQSLDSSIITDFNRKLTNGVSDEQRAALEGSLSTFLEQSSRRELFEPMDIQAESEGFDTLNAAITSANSSLGMSSEQVAALKERFEDMDTSNLFEYTTSGIKMNMTELNKLNSELIKTKKNQNDANLQALMDEYDSITKQIQKAENSGTKLELMNRRDELISEMQAAAELSAQYDALASSYNRWLNTKSSGDYGDQLRTMITGLEEVDQYATEGKFGRRDFRDYLDTIYGEDLSGVGIDVIEQKYNQLGETIEGTTYSLRDFMTGDMDGIDRWLSAISQLNSEWAHLDENGDWQINFDEEAVANALGISTEFLHQLIDAAQEFGAITYEGPLDQFERIKESAQEVAEVVKSIPELGLQDFNFNLNADVDGAGGLDEQITTLSAALDKLRNEDGTLNVSAEGVTEVQAMLEAVLIQKQQLEAPAILTCDASSLGEAQEAVNALKELYDSLNNYNNKVAVEADTTQARQQVQNALSDLKEVNLDVIPNLDLSNFDLNTENLEQNLKVGAELDPTNIKYIQDQISSIQPEDVKVGTEADTSTAQNQIDSIEAKEVVVPVTADTSAAQEAINSIQGKRVTVEVDYKHNGSLPKANGTANSRGSAYLRGTAYAHGNWATKHSENALVGELGSNKYCFINYLIAGIS